MMSDDESPSVEEALRELEANKATQQGTQQPRTDWELIEADYRTGPLSLREIASKAGITEGAIRKRAKKFGWVRKEAAPNLVRSSGVVSRGTKPRPPAAGKGRKPGSKNRVKKQTRELVQALVDENLPYAQLCLDKLRRKSPGKWLDAMTNLMEFCIARLQRIEVKPSLPGPDLERPITDPAEAADLYQRLLSDLTIDVTQVRFAPRPAAGAGNEPLVIEQATQPALPAPAMAIMAEDDPVAVIEREVAEEQAESRKVWGQLA
jgi:hypothetical protein